MSTPSIAPESAGRPARGLATIAVAAVSTQTGAAIGSLAFAQMTPFGVVAARQVVAAVVLGVIARPAPWRLTWRQWSPILLLALFFASMNSFLYAALDRIGLGTAVTIEFLGPLAVALVSSRRKRDLVCAVLALTGVVLLTRPGPTSDLLGLGFAVIAAGSWAGYILANRIVGARVRGIQGTAVATMVSALGIAPVAAVIIWHRQPEPQVLLFAAVAGVLASAVPYTLDLIVLRHISPVVFGLGMSLHPVVAALVGMIVLDEDLPAIGMIGILLVALSNGLALARFRRPGRRRRLDLDSAPGDAGGSMDEREREPDPTPRRGLQRRGS